jgi:hypothetical protein
VATNFSNVLKKPIIRLAAEQGLSEEEKSVELNAKA